MLKRQRFIIATVFVLVALLSACKTDTPAADTQNPGISLEITAETCPNATLNPNQQITWSNQDSKEHIVRENTAGKTSQFDSGTLQPGDSFSYTFLETGTFTYECSPNGTPLGTITVE
jgi:plastocyanin